MLDILCGAPRLFRGYLNGNDLTTLARTISPMMTPAQARTVLEWIRTRWFLARVDKMNINAFSLGVPMKSSWRVLRLASAAP
ncbi:hypothetical protein [Caballeronia sp. S22]|uniref:hypothetical protein n=1 Tax=Caballeronia sp. S22 TaxID=3137182 RepID=UPI0035311D8C